MTGRLDGKVAIITGGASGIGLETAKLFTEEGAKVAIADFNEAAGERALAEVAGGYFVKLNVTDEADWQKAIATVQEHFGGLDIVFNGAGIAKFHDVEHTTLEEWQQVIAVDGTGVFLGTKQGIIAMKDNGGGSIINISSIEGLVGEANLAAYDFAKGGVRLLTKSAALYAAENQMNIRVNSIHPGYIHTPMVDSVLGVAEAESKKTPMGHIGEALDIANMALFLASDESKFATGAEFVVDGGYTAQ